MSQVSSGPSARLIPTPTESEAVAAKTRFVLSVVLAKSDGAVDPSPRKESVQGWGIQIVQVRLPNDGDIIGQGRQGDGTYSLHDLLVGKTRLLH